MLDITWKNIEELNDEIVVRRCELLEPFIRQNQFGLKSILSKLKNNSHVVKDGFSLDESLHVRRTFPNLVYDVVRTYSEVGYGTTKQLLEITYTYKYPLFGIGEIKSDRVIKYLNQRDRILIGEFPSDGIERVLSGK